MNNKLSEKVIVLTSKLMMVDSRAEALKLSSEFNELAKQIIELEKNMEGAVLHTKSATASLEFTKKEIAKMAETFKKEFIANGLAAKVIKRKSGNNSFCYEIRYRSNGYNITASSTNLNEAKKKFLSKTTASEIEKYKAYKNKTVNSFRRIFDEWYQYKQGTITEKELNRFKANFNSLPIDLQEKPISEIRTADLDIVLKGVKPRKYEELRTLFNGVFKYAIASGIMTNNPVSLIRFKRAERKNRNALSREEIASFFQRLKEPKYDCIRQGAYLLYFFGLRPCEIDEETTVENGFLIARNRKRKNGKVEYKKIPIHEEANKYIDWSKPLTFQCSYFMQNKLFNELLGEGDNTTYCLRHTFSTVCQQHIRPDIVDIWMGDSPQRLVGKVYTHFPDEFMREQMDKVKFPLDV